MSLADRRRIVALAGRRPVRATEKNPHGYLPYDDVTPFALPVFGMAPGPSAESAQAGRDTSRIAWTLYCPPGVILDGTEEIQVDGEWLEVDGESRDWTRGPWPNPVAGVVVELLKRKG